MSILTSLNVFSRSRASWFLLLLSSLVFESCALYFQHILNLAPCVMCIYERLAMLGISGAAIVGMIAPKNSPMRWVSLALWGAAAYRGLTLAMEHVSYQLDPSPFNTCDIFVNFPAWLPLNKWAPWIFEAYGECSNIVWRFLSLSMPQWLVIIFAGNLIVLALVVIAQFFNKRSLFH